MPETADLRLRAFEEECGQWDCNCTDVTRCAHCAGQFCVGHEYHFCCTCEGWDIDDEDFITCMCDYGHLVPEEL